MSSGHCFVIALEAAQGKKEEEEEEGREGRRKLTRGEKGSSKVRGQTARASRGRGRPCQRAQLA